MSLTLGASTTSRWTSYAAWAQLRNHHRQVATGLADREQHVIATDRAAVPASENRPQQLRPGHTLDVTA